jgi:RNA polymerase sigma-70 factor, ECF subfamily
MQNNIDENLVVLFLAGDESAIQILVRKHTTGIYNFVSQFVGYGRDAEDVVQETFIKAWKNLKKFNPAKKFKPWLFRIARNSAIDFLRQHKITIPLVNTYNDEEINEADYLADSAPLPLEQAMTLETKQAVQNIIKSLPQIYSTVLKL